MTNISIIARRISIVLFVFFFLAFLALLGVAYLVGSAIDHSALVQPAAPDALACAELYLV